MVERVLGYTRGNEKMTFDFPFGFDIPFGFPIFPF